MEIILILCDKIFNQNHSAMRKTVLFIMIAVLTGLSGKIMSQAKHYVIFEHFTQASCGPCAQQNPFMQAVLDVNVGRTHHISYHTSWPGVDPMNAYNPSEVAARVGYYGVNAVPDVLGCGNQYHGSPTGVTQTLVDNLASDAAPIRVIVKETSNGTVRTVKVKVFTVDLIPTATYKIRVAVLEKMITYATPPGSNGEKNFPEVFRKMLPNTTGDPFTPAAIGDSVTFTYTYNLDLTTWDTTQIYSCAFIQDETTKHIVNSGAADDPHWELVSVDQNFKKGYTGEVVVFQYKVFNLGNTAENFRFKLNKADSAGWSSAFFLNGISFSDSTDIMMPAKTTWDLTVAVTIGSLACLGEYGMSMKSLDNSQFATVTLRSHVIYGVYELIINNDGGWGAGSSMTPATFQQKYIDGLHYAGSQAFGVIDLTSFKKGYNNNCLTQVTNYYFNVSWSFPSFTNESVAIFGAELDAGKNLFVSGQDVGWDTWDPTGSGTANTKAFYTNYLMAAWDNDGGTTNNQYIANASDPLFGQVPTSPVTNPYGGGYFYPDQIHAVGSGFNIFSYDAGATRKSAVRATNGTWKTAYLGSSLEMLSNADSRNQIIKISHDWFGGNPWTGIKPVGVSNLILLGQNYPNPANDHTTILLKNITKDMTLEVIDVTGRIVLKNKVSSGSTMIVINTSGLNSGMYFYRIISDGRVLDTRSMQVIR